MYLTIALAVIAWAISGIVTVTYMKAQFVITLTFVETKLTAIERHLESIDKKHEQLLRDFNDHRVQQAKQMSKLLRYSKSEDDI
jgi:hypothetical protein